MISCCCGCRKLKGNKSSKKHSSERKGTSHKKAAGKNAGKKQNKKRSEPYKDDDIEKAKTPLKDKVEKSKFAPVKVEEPPISVFDKEQFSS